MNTVKNIDELNKVGFAGFYFVQSENLWAVRLHQDEAWCVIPRDVLPPEKEYGMNSDELIGKLFYKGYFTEGNILIRQSKIGDYISR